MRRAPFGASLLAILLIVSPVAAHHKPDHGGGPSWDHPNGSQKKDRHDNQSEDYDHSPPDNALGKVSVAAHWCKWHFNDNESDWQFANHGQCVAFCAHWRHDDWDDDVTRPLTLHRGDLTIADVRARHDGTFRVRGFGAESTVQVWINGGSSLVVGFGQADPDGDDTWTVEGRWACQDDHDAHDARFRPAQDDDEFDREQATFPCDDLQPSSPHRRRLHRETGRS